MNRDLKAMWWNVHFPTFARNNNHVIEIVEQLGDFDVIALQEYVDGADDALKIWLEENDYDMLYLPFASRGKLSQGVMTAVKKDLKPKHDHYVLRRDAPKALRPFPNIRGIISTTLMIGGQDLHLINVHLTYPRRHTRDMRAREFDQFIETIEEDFRGEKLIIGGDFNFVGNDERRNYLTNEFEFSSGGKLKKTWRYLSKYSPIAANLDYIFWENFETHPTVELGPFRGSDHRPLLVTIDKQDVS